MFTSQLQVYDALFSEISPSSVSGSDLSKMALWESRISRQYTTCQLGGQGSHRLDNCSMLLSMSGIFLFAPLRAGD